LPRYAGPIAAFLLGHPDSSRADLLDFIEATFAVRVSRIALYKFLKKFGLDHLGGPEQPPARLPPGTPAATPPSHPAPASAAPPRSPQPPAPAAAQAAGPGRPESPGAIAPASLSGSILLPEQALVPAGPPAPPFCSAAPSTPAPSC
jgi:hypothetical protein